LSTSVRLRTTTTIPRPSNPHHPRLAILFSGGLDCTLLAALAHRHLPLEEPIDLLNVAFENPRALKASHKTRAAGGAAVDPYGVPDRRTGIEGVAELRRVCGGREWRFVRIDVPFEEAMGCKERILGLMAPLDTVMDLSIAMAFWFAARGKGVVKDEESGEEREYTSQARVLFSGLGADEQLAGYGRHTARFQKEGWSGLLTEVSLDVGRIAQRNLGRDDRIVADHGKEVRFPFLDESVVTFLSSLPIYIKADPRYRKGIGEKMLLRQYACSEWMGLSRAGVEPKRAVQFGARTAKMVDGGEKGVDRIGASE
ncbi:asparagine synthase, partial [Cladochytrium replicatum]